MIKLFALASLLCGVFGIYIDQLDTPLHVNIAPSFILSIPKTLSVPSGQSLSITGLTVVDPDIDLDYDGTILLTLSCGHCELSLTQIEGVFIDLTVPSTVSLTGSLNLVNQALATLIYTSNPSWSGLDSIGLVANDQGYSGSGGAMVTNDGFQVLVTSGSGNPSITMPPGLYIDGIEDTLISLSTVSVSYITSQPIVLQVSSSSGIFNILPINGVTITTLNGGSKIELRGLVSNINLAISSSLTYTPPLNFNILNGGVKVLSFAILQNNILIYSQILEVLFNPINDAPVILVNEGNVFQDYQGKEVSVNGISISDVDYNEISSGYLTVVLTVQNGILKLPSMYGLVTIQGDPENGSAAITLNGNLANLNIALSNLIYVSDNSWFGRDSIDISVNDNGFTGAGQPLVATTTIFIDVLQRNYNTIINTAFQAVSMKEGEVYSLNGFSVDATESKNVIISVSVLYGGISFSPLSYWVKTLVGTGKDDSFLEFQGPISLINNALDTLTYKPNNYWSGIDTLTFSIVDADTLMPSASTLIPINVSPVENTPEITTQYSSFSVNEDDMVLISGIKLIDYDECSLLTLSLSVENGFLYFSKISSTILITQGSLSSSSVTLQGSASNLQNLMEHLVYYGNENWYGTDMLTIKLSMLSNAMLSAEKTVSIIVSPVNDPPTISIATTTYSVSEGGQVAIPNIVVADIDMNEQLNMQMSIEAVGGKMQLAPISANYFKIGSGLSGDETIVLLAPINTLNAALAGLIFIPLNNFFGVGSVTISINDLGAVGIGEVGTATQMISIFVTSTSNHFEVVVPSSNLVVNEDEIIYINAVSVVNAAGRPDALYKVSLYGSNGKFSVTNTDGLQIVVQDNYGIDFISPLSLINTVLATASYLPFNNFYGDDTLVVEVNNENEDTTLIIKVAKNIKVHVLQINDAPTIQYPLTVNVNEDTINALINGIVIGDVDIGNGKINCEISAVVGVLTIPLQANDIVIKSGTGMQDSIVSFDGTLDAINLAVSKLMYSPPLNWNSYSSGSDIITIHVSDSMSKKTASITVFIIPRDDLPQIILQGPINVDEDVEILLGNSIQVSDPDLDDSVTGLLKVSLSVVYGTIILPKISQVQRIQNFLASSSQSLSFYGSVQDINYAISLITYLSEEDWSGTDSISIIVENDTNESVLGNLDINVNSVNDVPIVIIPFTMVEANEDTILPLNFISVYDVDVDSLRVTISVLVGYISFNVILPDITMVIGNGKGQEQTISIEGDSIRMNLMLQSLIYTPYLNMNSIASSLDTITVTATNKGFTGGGVVQTTSKSFTIFVNPVNDDSVITVSDAEVLCYENERCNSFSGIVNIEDVDYEETVGAMLQVILSVGKGQISIENFIPGLSSLSNSDSSQIILTAKSSILNNALQQISYFPNFNYYGAEVLTISVGEYNNNIVGHVVISSKDFSVTQIKNPPTLKMVGFANNQVVNLIENEVYSTPQIIIEDIDSPNSAIYVVLSCSLCSFVYHSTLTEYVDVIQNDKGSSSITFIGTASDLSVLLSDISYYPTANFHGIDIISYSISINSNGMNARNFALIVKVKSINNAPVITLNSKSLTVSANAKASSLSGMILVSDPDNDFIPYDSSIECSLSVTNGAILLSSTRPILGLSFSSGKNDGTDIALTLTGSITTINNALDALVYKPNTDFSGSDQLSIIINDFGNSGFGGSLSATASIPITVLTFRKLPTFTSATALFIDIDEDETLHLNGWQFSSNDNEWNVASVYVYISSVHGSFALQSGDAINVIETSPTDIILNGLISDINIALESLTYVPNLNWNGIWSNNLATTNKGRKPHLNDYLEQITVRITSELDKSYLDDVDPISSFYVNIDWINDAPEIDCPNVYKVVEGTNTFSYPILLNDVDADETYGSKLDVILSVLQGSLNLDLETAIRNGVTFLPLTGGSDPSKVIKIQGSITGVQNSVKLITYTTPAVGIISDTLTISVNDLGNSGRIKVPLITSKTVAIDIVHPNHPPIIIFTQVSPQNIMENEISFVSLSISDTDGVITNAIDVILQFEFGLMSFLENLNNIQFGSDTDLTVQRITLSGDQSIPVVHEVQLISTYCDIGSSIGGYFTLSFENQRSSLISSSATAMEVSNVLSSLSTIGSSVSVSGSINSNRGYTWSITFGSSSSSPSNFGNVASLIVDGSGLTGTNAGASVSTQIPGSAPIYGTFIIGYGSEKTSHLPWDASAVEVSNAIRSFSSQFTVSVERIGNINNIPGFSWMITFVSDVPSSLLTVQSELLPASSPIIAVSPVSSSFHIAGLLPDINIALSSSFTYHPQENWNSRVNGLEKLKITVSDRGTLTDSTAAVSSSIFYIFVKAVNSLPVISYPNSIIQTIRGQTFYFGDLLISDADIDETFTSYLTVSLSCLHGAITLNKAFGLTLIVGTGSNDAAVSFSGKLSTIKKALPYISYKSLGAFNSQIGSNPEVQVVSTRAPDTMEVRSITTYLKSGYITGTFDLILTINHGTYISITSLSCSITDANLASALNAVLTNVDVTASRSVPSLQGGYTWLITFAGAGLAIGYPQIYMDPTNLSGAVGSGTIEGNSQTVVTGYFPMSGFFTLSFGGEITPPLSFDIEASDMKVALQGLSTIGEVNVDRLVVNDQNDYDWTITFLCHSVAPCLLGPQKLLVGDSTLLHGSLFITELTVGTVSQYDQITITADDNGFTGQNIGGITSSTKILDVLIISVNNAPHAFISGSSNFKIVEDETLYISGVTVNDIDFTSSSDSLLILTVSCTSGALSINNNPSLVTYSSQNLMLQISGSIDVINTALTSLTYKPNEYYNGRDFINIVVSDNGYFGIGGPLSSTLILTVDVTAVNNPPTIASPGVINVDAGETVQILMGLSISDPDSNESYDNRLLVTVQASSGLLSLRGISQYVADIVAQESNSLTFLAGLNDLANIFYSCIYYTAEDNILPGASVTVVVNDQGHTGAGGIQTASAVVNIVAAVTTLKPSISILFPNSVFATNEDEPVELSGCNVQVRNPISPNTVYSVTLSATHGSIVLGNSNLADVSFLTNELSTIIFKGTLENVNYLLSDIVYLGFPNWNGYDSVSIIIDFTDAMTGQVTTFTTFNKIVNVRVYPVNDPPTISVDVESISVPEDGSIFIPAPIIVDVDYYETPDAMLKLVISSSHGSFSFLNAESFIGMHFLDGGDGLTPESTISITSNLYLLQNNLQNILFYPDADYNGITSISYTISESGVDASASIVIGVQVTPIKKSPLIRSTSGSFNVDEDTNVLIGPFIVTDVDSQNFVFTIDIVCAFGRFKILTLNDVNLLPNGIVDNSYSSLSFKGALLDVNKALSSLEYFPLANFNGLDSISISVTDKDSLESSLSLDIFVHAINDAPTIMLSVDSFTCNENETCTVPSMIFNDVDITEAGGGVLTVSFQSVKGSLLLDNLTPGVWIKDSTDSMIVIVGSLENMNTVVQSGYLSYLPPVDFFGVDLINIKVSDAGGDNDLIDSSFSTATINVKVQQVDDAPLIKVGGYIFKTSEDSLLSIAPVTILKSNADNEVFSILLTSTFGSLQIDNNPNIKLENSINSQTIKFHALLADVNNALTSLEFICAPFYNGLDYVDIQVEDSESNIVFTKFTIVITAVNNPPTILIPDAFMSTLVTLEDISLNINGIVVNDVDVDETIGSMLSVKLSVGNGDINCMSTLGLAIQNSNGDFVDPHSLPLSSFTFSGNSVYVNKALSSLIYTPNADWSGADVLSISVSDNGNTGYGGVMTDEKSINVEVQSVNDAPTITLSLPQVNTDEDVAIDMKDIITIIDIDGKPNDVLNILIASTTGINVLELFSTSGLILGPACAIDHTVLEFKGILSDIMDSLATLQLVPNQFSSGVDSLAITATDSLGASSTVNLIVNVRSINNPPKIMSLFDSITLDEDSPTAINGISVSDVDIDTIENGLGYFTTTISAGTGTVSVKEFPGVYFIGERKIGSKVIFSSSSVPTNQALSSIIYQSALNVFGNDVVTIEVSDNGFTGFGGIQTSQKVINVIINAVNHAPIIISPQSILSVDDDTDLPIYKATGIKIVDVDCAQTDAISVSLSCTHGTIQLASDFGLLFSEGSGIVSSSRQVFRGSLENVNSALLELVYRGSLYFSGTDSIVIWVNDEGHNGKGGPLTNSASIAVSISAVNHPPQFILPLGSISVNENTPVSLLVSITDVDAELTPDSYLEVGISSSSGADLEVQTITSSATHINYVQTVTTSASAALSGSFTLSLLTPDGRSFTTSAILYNAVSTIDNELNSAGHPESAQGASMQSILQSLGNIGSMSVEVYRSGPTSTNGYTWTITFLNAPANLKPLVLGVNSLLPGASSSVTINSLISSNSIGGTFFINFMGKSTVPMPSDVSALGLKTALEELPNCQTVDVKVSGPDLQLGYTWTITFFSTTSMGDVAALVPVTSSLTGLGVKMVVTEVVKGNGIPELQVIQNIATHVNMIQTITVSATSTISGYFSLALDLTSLGGRYAVTSSIQSAAVASVSDEFLSHSETSSYGESMQSKVQALSNFHSDVINLYDSALVASISDMSVSVSRTGPDAFSGYTWSITFYNAPYNLPPLTLASSNLYGTGVSVSILQVVQPNGLGGTFTLSFGDSTTSPLPFDASADNLRSALLLLPSIVSTSLSIGDVLVTRSVPDLQGGYTWNVVFTEEHYKSQNVLIAYSKYLTGIGASSSVRVVRTGGEYGTFSLGETANLMFNEGGGGGKWYSALTFRGSLSNLNAALSTLRYQGATNWFGLVNVVLTANDFGFTGAGGPGQSVASLPIQVLSLNNAPGISDAPDTFVSVLEDIDTSLSWLVVSDVDSGSDSVTLTISTLHGFVSVDQVSPLNGNTFLVLTDSVYDINIVLQSLIYRGNLNYNGIDIMTVTLNDNGWSGIGGPITVSKTFMFNVQAVNDVPIISTSVPSLSGMEDTLLYCSGITISDPDVNDDPYNLLFIELTLSVSSGVIWFSGVEGVYLVSGGFSNGAINEIIVRGSIESVNYALESLMYMGNVDWHGNDLLSISVNDLGNFGLGGPLHATSSIAITISPIVDNIYVLLPNTYPVVCLEDEEYHIQGIQIIDPDAYLSQVPSVLSLTIVVQYGTLTLGRGANVIFTNGDGNRDTSMTFTGSMSEINYVLTQFIYRGSLNWNSIQNGVDTITFTISDISSSKTTVRGSTTELLVYVEAINDSPVFILPGQVLDPILKYQDDLSNLIVSVNTITLNEDEVIRIEGISVRDVDVTESPDRGLLTVSISSINGLVSVGSNNPIFQWLKGDGSPSSILSFISELNGVNLILAKLTYSGAPFYNGLDSITFSVNDMGNYGLGGPLSDLQVIPISIIAVNNAPVISVPLLPLSVNEDNTLMIAGVNVFDVDIGNNPIKISIIVENGFITLRDVYGLTFETGTGTLDSYLVFTGFIDKVNSALENAIYQPSPYWNSYYKQPDVIHVRADDGGSTGIGGPNVVINFFEIVVLPVNNPPTIAAPGLHMGYDYNGENVVSSVDTIQVYQEVPVQIIGVSFDDVDVNETPGASMEARVTSSFGTILFSSLNGLTFVNGIGDGTCKDITFRGTLSALNAAVEILTYTGDLHYNGMDSMTISINDLGNTGAIPSGRITNTEDQQCIQVRASNPNALIGSVSGQSIQVLLPSVSSSPVTINVSDGIQTVQQSIASLWGSVASQTVVDSVTLNVLPYTNTWCISFSPGLGELPQLQVVPSPSSVGVINTLSFITQKGISEPNESRSAQVTIPISILPVNDGPHWSILNQVFSVNEDFATTLSGISIVDDDLGSGVLTVTISINHGMITLNQVVGLTFATGDGDLDKFCTFSGLLNDINAALDQMMYQPDENFNTVYNDMDVITLIVSDNGNIFLSSFFTVKTEIYIQNVFGVNDAPVIQVPGAHLKSFPCNVSIDSPIELDCGSVLSVDIQVGFEDEDLVIPGISVSDVDLTDTFGATLEVRLEVSFGKLTLSSINGLYFTTINDVLGSGSVISFKANLFDSNLALNNIVYRGNQDWYGIDYFVITVNDQGFTGSGGVLTDTQTIPIQIQEMVDDPVLYVPTSTLVAIEDNDLLIPGVFVYDVDARNGQIDIHLIAGSGTLSVGDPEITSKFQYYIGDPYYGRLLPEGNIDNEGRRFSSEIGFVGRLEEVNAALADLKYLPNLNYNSDTSLPDTLIISVNNRGLYGLGDAQSVVATIYINVLPVNDSPVLDIVDASYDTEVLTNDGLSFVITSVPMRYVDEDESLALSGISFRDIDINELVIGKVDVVVQCVNGFLSMSWKNDGGESINPFNFQQSTYSSDLTGLIFSEGDASGSYSKFRFSSTIDIANAALATLTYQGNPDFYGFDNVIVTVFDNGFTGSVKTIGLVSLFDSLTIPITVRGINDAPVITIPLHEDGSSLYVLDEGTGYRISGVTNFQVYSSPNPTPVYQTGYELWRSEVFLPLIRESIDWRVSLVKDINTGFASSNPGFFKEYNSALYFTANDGIHGNELWVTDGTLQGTKLVKDIYPGSKSSTPTFLTVFNGNLFFAANGIDVTWMLVTDSCNGFKPSSVNSNVFFAVSSSTTWQPDEVLDCPSGYHWASTKEGIALFPTSAASAPSEAFTYYNECGWNGYIYNGQERRYFRFSDSKITGAVKKVGMGESVEPIFDIFDNTLFAGLVCVLGDEIQCETSDENCYIRAGNELWISDGTIQGTSRVIDIQPGVPPSNPSYLTVMGSWMYFNAYTDPFGSELWVTDGTRIGTTLVQDINKGLGSSNPRFLVVFNNILYFSGVDEFLGEELWRSDGVVGGNGAGTYLIKDISVGATSSSPTYLTVSGGKLYFAASESLHGNELWMTDGTQSGTTMVKDINIGSGSSNPMYLVNYNGILFFAANDGVYGSELWRSDGTSGGTYLLRDCVVGSFGSNPSYLTVFTPTAGLTYPYGRSNISPTLIFIAGTTYGQDAGTKLWVSDGTTLGTTLAFTSTDKDFDIDPMTSRGFPNTIAQFQGSIYLSLNYGNADVIRPNNLIIGGTEGIPQSIVITDIDAGNSLLTFNISATKGLITFAETSELTFLEGDGNKDQTIVFMATLIAANNAFRAINYDTLPFQNGEDKIIISVNDNGATGFYGKDPQITTTSIDIWIESVNNPPTITAPGNVIATIDDKFVIEGISAFDVDIDTYSRADAHGQQYTGLMTVYISVTAGRVTLQELTGLSFEIGDGIHNSRMQFTGMINFVNEALERITYICESSLMCGSAQTDTIMITISDNGFSGKAVDGNTNLSDTAYITINLNANEYGL